MVMIDGAPGAVALGAEDAARAVAAVKARLRIVSVEEDALIAAFAESALGLAEQVTGQATVARAMVQELIPHGGWQRLVGRPVRSIDAVTDADGAALPVGSYAVDVDTDGMGWVRVVPGTLGGERVRVTYAAGIAADWGALPAGLREGAAMLAAHLFDDRTGAQPVPAAVAALWRPFRVARLGLETRAGVAA